MASNAYIGRASCGCVVAITIDDPSNRERTAARVGELIVDGLAVERLPLNEAKAALTFCVCDGEVDDGE